MGTTFLFAIPTFLSGFARLLDLGGFYNLYNESQDENVADARALYSDFRMVGQDLQHAMELLSTTCDEKLTPEKLFVAIKARDAEMRHGA